MKIEYIYPDNKANQELERQIRKENTIGCLITGLFFLITLFIILTLLPFILAFLGWMILFTAFILIYKMYLESPLLNFIQKMKSRK